MTLERLAGLPGMATLRAFAEERPEPPPEFKPCTAKTLMPLSTQVTQGSTANGLTEPTAVAAAHYIGGSAAMMEGLISEEGQELCCCSM